jgi:hypothetical protein
VLFRGHLIAGDLGHAVAFAFGGVHGGVQIKGEVFFFLCALYGAGV